MKRGDCFLLKILKLKSGFVYSIVALTALLCANSCTKLVEAELPGIYTPGEDAFGSDANAIAVLNGIYANMSTVPISQGGSFNSFMSLYPGLSADEFTLFSGVTNSSYVAYYHNDLLNTTGPNIWTSTYPFINRINLAILGISASEKLTDRVKNQLLGEAKFLRALNYFYLVNLYGPVPLVLIDDYKKNALLPRSSVDDVYKQVIEDLSDAIALLSDNFVGGNGYSVSNERVVPNKWAAKALLARVYLYTKKYSEAVTLSTEVINNSSLFSLVDLDNVFLKNSAEAIWQLQPVNSGWNTEDARVFIIPESGPSDIYPVYLSDSLLKSFEPGDNRKVSWVNSVTIDGISYLYPYKYKNVTYNGEITEYQMVMRLAEQYLIRAEGNAELNNLTAAIDDINVIRNRAGLADYAGEEDKVSILLSIYHENRIEFFSEWGHRWLDLKRLSQVNTVMSNYATLKGGSYNPNDQLYPIYKTELTYNPNLVQNDGY